MREGRTVRDQCSVSLLIRARMEIFWPLRQHSHPLFTSPCSLHPSQASSDESVIYLFAGLLFFVALGHA